MKKYNGHFPIWVIIEFFSFGTLSYFYRGMKNNDKAAIAANLYSINYQTLDSWIQDCITGYFRQSPKCRHQRNIFQQGDCLHNFIC